jgi:hypothetical protein
MTERYSLAMEDQLRASQAFWDERYACADYRFGKIPHPMVCRLAQHLPAGARVLAVADGEGRNGVALAGLGFQVTAFDVSPLGVEKARRLQQSLNVPPQNYQTCVAGVDDFNWPSATCDAVLAVFVQFAPPSMRLRMFLHFRNVLKLGGLLALVGYRPEQIAYGTGGHPDPLHLYTKDLLVDAFGDMAFLHFESLDVELSEGAGHQGKSAVIELLARKSVA